ncbi:MULTISPECIES: MFS transporter [Ramlibacter]|uniref:MFS transporter n=1 Tax=Ramlibacter pinisoli TaxID=2682844 RepID=A0A6N8IU08_9BURK|nr:MULTISPECIES: MFS transporter [Ramlibacter]MBA2965445.1 MFS transporter [Ramlibacter sp. CGMCC 1.13660]MVQ30411.1 MFS transporter [Ramlibacter pinisoli]
MATTASPPAPSRTSFAALRHPGFRAQVGFFLLAMMADNVEHVISYWMAFQKFQSPALGGFAVVSHWLPFLLFSVPVGALADRFDPRRIIQCGMGLFMLASAGWAYFLITDTLQLWHAMALLVVHGCAGVLWQGATQMLLYDVVPAPDLPSAVRLLATARSLGVLVGPAVGGALMATAGPRWGLLLNVLFFLPNVLWLWKAPYGPRFRAAAAAPARAVRGLADIARTLGEIRADRRLVSMIALAGLASLLVGNSYQAQMPGFASDLGHGEAGATYSMLLAADAAGALLAGLLLETRGGLLRPAAGTALGLAMLWCCALAGFGATGSYPLALVLLFAAGVFELAFSSMAQALVQLHAPTAARGRVIGVFNMAALGLRAFAGITVGLGGSAVGIHASLVASSLALLLALGVLLAWLRTSPPAGA